MTLELKRVDPLRAANVGALVYGLLLGAFALLFFPIMLLIAVLSPSEEFGAGGLLFPVFFLVLYPVMGLVMGWISGLLSSAIYNFIIRWSGGLLLEFDGDTVGTGSGAV